MKKLTTSSEIEKKVLNHIIKKTQGGFITDFNPLEITAEIIAGELDLDIDDVDEAIYNLKSTKRIELIKSKFEMWIPNNKDGKDIKDELCTSGLAINGSINALYSFIFLLILYVSCFYYLIPENKLIINSSAEYYVLGTIITAISIPIGIKFAQKVYSITNALQKIKGVNYYIYTFMVISTITIIGINKGWTIATTITIIAGIAEILTVLFQIINNQKKKE